MNQTAFPTNKNSHNKIVAIIIATLFAATTSLLGVSAANAASGPYYNNCGAPSIKPTSITQYCADAGSGVTKIQWISWTAKSAKGYGTFYINSCDPNCASGKVYKTSVDVTLNSPAFTARNICCEFGSQPLPANILCGHQKMEWCLQPSPGSPIHFGANTQKVFAPTR